MKKIKEGIFKVICMKLTQEDLCWYYWRLPEIDIKKDASNILYLAKFLPHKIKTEVDALENTHKYWSDEHLQTELQKFKDFGMYHVNYGFVAFDKRDIMIIRCKKDSKIYNFALENGFSYELTY